MLYSNIRFGTRLVNFVTRKNELGPETRARSLSKFVKITMPRFNTYLVSYYNLVSTQVLDLVPSRKLL